MGVRANCGSVSMSRMLMLRVTWESVVCTESVLASTETVSSIDPRSSLIFCATVAPTLTSIGSISALRNPLSSAVCGRHLDPGYQRTRGILNSSLDTAVIGLAISQRERYNQDGQSFRN